MCAAGTLLAVSQCLTSVAREGGPTRVLAVVMARPNEGELEVLRRKKTVLGAHVGKPCLNYEKSSLNLNDIFGRLLSLRILP